MGAKVTGNKNSCNSRSRVAKVPWSESSGDFLLPGAKCRGTKSPYPINNTVIHTPFLSASLYVSKRGAYWDRLCRDVVGWLVVTRVHCGQTVHPRPIVTLEH